MVQITSTPAQNRATRATPTIALQQTRAPMRRKGSVKARVKNPSTVAERLTARRLELNLSQSDVAERVRFYNQSGGEWKTLSRSAYCMYETGEVTPDIEKLYSLAEVLKSTPEWLAFGTGERVSVSVVEWQGKAKGFMAVGTWGLDPEWLESNMRAPIKELSLVMSNDFGAYASPGDMMIVHTGQEPDQAGGVFVYATGAEMHAAQITRPSGGTNYRIFADDLRSYEDVSPRQLTILGRLVGSIATVS